MDEVLMMLVSIKLTQECLEFVPNVPDAALFYTTIAKGLIWKLDTAADIVLLIFVILVVDLKEESNGRVFCCLVEAIFAIIH